MHNSPTRIRSARPLSLLMAPLLCISALACGGDEEPAERAPAADLPAAADQTESAETGQMATSSERAGWRTDTRGALGAHVYECDGAVTVSTETQKTGDLYLFLPDRTVDLPHVPAASGARYSDGTVTFWTKGSEATLERGSGETLRCREDRAASIRADAVLRGVDFWATGNEPGWLLEIGPDLTSLVADYGQRELEFPTTDPVVEQAGRRTTYRTSAEGHTLQIEILGDECFDDMSGERFESLVRITLDGEALRGCGTALR